MSKRIVFYKTAQHLKVSFMIGDDEFKVLKFAVGENLFRSFLKTHKSSNQQQLRFLGAK